MKFQVDRDVFTETVAWTARSLPSRPAAPVLAGLLFDAVADPGTVSVSGFDYETSSRAEFAADVVEPGRVLVHGRLLADIAKALPNHPVQLATEGSKVLLSCGSSQFVLQTLPVGDYPALPVMPPAAGTVPAADLAAAVAQVAVAASRDDTIPMLTGIRIEIAGDTLTLVSTDRFRLAYRELPWRTEVPTAAKTDAAADTRTGTQPDTQTNIQPDAQPDAPAEAQTDARTTAPVELAQHAPQNPSTATDPTPAVTALIPAKVMAAAARSMAGREQVTLALSDRIAGEGLIGFAGGDHPSKGSRHLTSRLLSGEFVKYRSLFPDDYAITATVETAPFLAAAKRVALVADRTSPLHLAFTRGQVGLRAGAGDEAQAAESLEAVVDGADIAVSYNPAYLIDGLHAIDTEYAQLSFTVPGKPTVLMPRQSLETPARQDFRYLMLPLKASVPPASS